MKLTRRLTFWARWLKWFFWDFPGYRYDHTMPDKETRRLIRERLYAREPKP